MRAPAPPPVGGPRVELAGGTRLPVVGLGTYRLTGRSGRRAMSAALDAGYRHLDTATMYGNEAEVGRAVRDSGVPRSEVVVTTKLWPDDADRVRPALDASLARLGLDYVDLWLVHWPPGGARPDTWAELLAARDAGLVRSVGVSNYSVAQIDELVAATGEAPAVDQVQWDPGRFDPQFLDACRARGVVVEGWSPLRGTDLRHPVLVELARRHGVTPAQIVLRWNLEHGVVVIPKSSDPARLHQNLDLFGFALDDDEVAALDRQRR